MKLTIMKFIFTIIIFVCSTLIQSIANEEIKFPSFVDELQLTCENEISLHFNAEIPNINQDFVNSPLLGQITCLNLTDSKIEKIERGAFNNLPNLTHLFLSNNRIDESEFFNFGGHYKLKSLFMNNASGSENRNEGIRIYDEFPNLEILSLRSNSFYDLCFSFSCDIFQKTTFPKLSILDMSKNNIKRTNFLSLLPSSLYFLDLHDNSLKHFELKIANKLYALNLNNNNFYHIGDHHWQYLSTLWMTGLTNLHYLSVSTNNIESIDENAFRDTSRLLYLNLSSNRISYLYPRIFINLQHLKTLDLSANKLKNFPQIPNITEISTLYINHNNITKLISHDFVQMPKLTKLLLGENHIYEINVNAFANLSILEELDLSRNMLSFLPEGWTESLISLKYLDLSENRFTSLESLSMTNTLSLIEIYLTKNPLEYLNIRSFENLPQNITVNLKSKSNFTKWIPIRIDPKENKKSHDII